MKNKKATLLMVLVPCLFSSLPCLASHGPLALAMHHNSTKTESTMCLDLRSVTGEFLQKTFIESLQRTSEGNEINVKDTKEKLLKTNFSNLARVLNKIIRSNGIASDSFDLPNLQTFCEYDNFNEEFISIRDIIVNYFNKHGINYTQKQIKDAWQIILNEIEKCI